MNLHALIPLTAALVNLALTLFVISGGLRSSINRVYLLWGASITIWNLGTAFMFQVDTQNQALFWAHFLQIGVIFLPVSLFHLGLLIADIRLPRVLLAAYCMQIGLAITDLFWNPGLFVKDVKPVEGYHAFYSQAGPCFGVYVATYTLLTVSTIILLYRKMQSLPALHRTRVKSLLLASTLLIAFGGNDILPILGFERYPGTNILIFPFGSLAAIVFGLLVGYSTLQHQLLDVQVAMSHVVAHVIRLAFLFLIGLVLLLTSMLFQSPERGFNAYSLSASLVALLGSGIIASIYFPRLFGSGAEALERRIIGDRFEYHDQIRSFIASMQWYSDKNLLLSDLNNLLVKTVRVSAYKIILLDETSKVFALFRSHPEMTEPQDFPELDSASPILKFFTESRAESMAINSAYARPGGPKLEMSARAGLQEFGAEFCFPFWSEDEVFGLLLLGQKTNDDPYTATDISLMVSLVKHLSLVINQIRLKNQILLSEELDLLGRMSRGMAHDLNNLLTPIWTLLQLVNEEAPVEALREELLPVALRNVKAIRAYIRESLFFSKNLRPDIQLGRLDLVVSQAVEMVHDHLKRKNMEATVESPTDVLVEMDEVLIQRLIANLISNAVDASPAKSQIRVHLTRLAKTEVNRDWLRLSIRDQGEGIKDENLNRIFTPYFTTKDRGDENRGFGLGLAICRKIVMLHGGNLNIASEVNKGTTVTVDLPSRQSKLTPTTRSFPVTT